MSRDARTVLGFLILLAGAAGGAWLGWWLGTEGDVIELLRRAKLSLPGWMWWAIKVGLSAAFGGIFVLFFTAIAFLIFRGGK